MRYLHSYRPCASSDKSVDRKSDFERLRATERQCAADDWMNRTRSGRNGRAKVADAVAPLLAQVEQGHGYVCSRYWRKFNKWGQPYGRVRVTHFYVPTQWKVFT